VAPDTLVEPAYFTYPDYRVTLADEYVDLAKLAGFAPDPEQELVLGPMCAIDARSRPVGREVSIVAPRQNIKTGLFKIGALGDSFLMGVPLVVWSAHEYDTAHMAFVDLCELIESTTELDSRVKRILTGNGKESIELLNGSLIKFKARTKKGGRGLAGQRVTLDEAFALLPAHMASLLFIISAQAATGAQLRYGSSACLADSEVLRSIVERGRVGSPRLIHAEWCDETPCADDKCTHLYDARLGRGPEGCALDRVEGWRKSNSQAGRRIELETIDSERRALARIPLEFARERLGWHDEPGELEHLFGAVKWANCYVKGVRKPPTEGMALAVAVALDRSASCITSATPLPGRKLVGVVHHQYGTAGLIAEAKRLQDKYDCPLVVDDHGPAADLIGNRDQGKASKRGKVWAARPSALKPVDQASTLLEAGVAVTVAETSDVLDAFAAFYDAVQVQGIAHNNHPELEAAIKGGTPRMVGDRKAIGRKQSGVDVSPVEGVVLAAYFTGTKRKRRRPRSAVVG